MGKGNYNGEIHEMVMFFLNKDFDIDCDVSSFVKQGNIFVSNIKYQNYNFVLKTKHFNINVLAEDIIKKLSELNIKDFQYKIIHDNALRRDAISVIYEKFNHRMFDIDIGFVYFNPHLSEYNILISINGHSNIYKTNFLNKSHIISIGRCYINLYPEYTI